MSIQNLNFSAEQKGSAQIERKINEGATGLIMDTIMITQYAKPLESTVRELAANAVDSQVEKEIAISILEGKNSPEEFFINRKEDGMNANSGWNPDYFDLDHLNRHNNFVEIIYKEGKGTGYSDWLIVKDHGVGLGDDRLEGYFQIG